jgi:hypothetical protein
MKEQENLHPEKVDEGHQYLRREGKHVRMPKQHQRPICFSSIINVPEKKFLNLKFHNCHVLMTQLLSVALRGILPSNV